MTCAAARIPEQAACGVHDARGTLLSSGICRTLAKTAAFCQTLANCKNRAAGGFADVWQKLKDFAGHRQNAPDADGDACGAGPLPGRARAVRRGGERLTERLFTARTPAEQRRGLLGREGLADGEALYFPGVRMIHTVGMRFAIDVAFLSPDGVVKDLRFSLRPGRLLAFCREPGRASALEAAAGTWEAWHLKTGDKLEITDL